MNIAQAHLEALQAFGYSETEARFLYIVLTHSGYFVGRQFLGFARCHWGGRTATFWKKLQTNKHARVERFPKSGTIYRLFSRRLYRQLDRENIRNRREHEIEYIQRRIGMLDFVLSHPYCEYLETEPEKVRFFGERCNVPTEFLPAKIYHGQRNSQPTIRYFVDRFPIYLDQDPGPPVVTFTYIPGPVVSHSEFIHHLEDYLALFRKLPEFRFVYLSRVDFYFERAKELFNSIVAIPLGSDVSADLVRYFQVRKAWDLGHYTLLSEADLIFRNEARSRFVGQRFEHLYREWKRGRVDECRIRQQFGGTGSRTIAHFSAQVLQRFGNSEAKGASHA
jgi:hypothetical protein